MTGNRLMRLETFNANATGAENAWVFDAMTTEDGLSHLQGLAEIEVIEDQVEKLPPPPEWDGPTYARRTIRGVVKERLHMWDERSAEFGKDHFLGGICISGEGRRYLMGQTGLKYDGPNNILTVEVLDTTYD